MLDAYDRDIWEAGRKVVSAIWEAHGCFWHGIKFFFFCYFLNFLISLLAGYEIHGMDNIPPGGALLVYYHGAIPLDFYYICSHILLYKGRLVNPVGDRFLFKVPGIYILFVITYC